MKYLFFDIECAGVFKNVAKICAFGYCLTDEKFNILEKEDILINPQGGFHLTVEMLCEQTVSVLFLSK